MPASPLPTPLLDRPFTTRMAADLGVTAAQLRRRDLVHVGRALYVGPKAPQSWLTVAAGWLRILPPGTVLHGASALAVFGIPVPPTRTVHVLVPPTATRPRSRPGLRVHRWHPWPSTTVVAELPVVSPATAWCQLGAVQQKADIVIAGDASLTAGLINVAEVRALVDGMGRRRGVVLLRECLDLLRPGVDSPPESLVRLAMVDAGLPEPEVNPDLFDDSGGWIGRPDLAYRLLRLAIQYEGDIHRTDQRRWRQDISRDEVLRDHGWDVIRVTAADLRDPAALGDRILHRMRRQAHRLGVEMPG